MFRRLLIGLGALLLTLGSATPLAAQDANGEPLRVVTSFSILDDLVRHVGGDAVSTHALAPAGVDSHTFEPAPADIGTLVDADLVFAIGLDYEPWLDGLIASSGTGAPVILVSEHVTPLTFGEDHDEDRDGDHADEEHADDDDAGHDDHGHGAFDPHIWHDVTNAIIIVETVRDALVEADPDNAATYEANAAAYIAELEALDAWVMEQVATLPEDQRRLVTSHEALAYYANRYGFEMVGTVFGTLSTEAGDPAAADVARLVAEIQAQNVPAIFAENTSNPDLMEAVAAEAGVTLAPTLYTDALGPAGSGVESYVDLIRTNTESIVTALSGE